MSASFMKPFVKSTSSFPYYFIKTLLLEKTNSMIAVVIFNYVYVLLSTILVAVSLEKSSLMCSILKYGLAHNPTLHYGHKNFVCVVFSKKHTAPNSHPFQWPVFVVSVL